MQAKRLRKKRPGRPVKRNALHHGLSVKFGDVAYKLLLQESDATGIPVATLIRNWTMEKLGLLAK